MTERTVSSLIDLAIAGEKCSQIFYDGLARKFSHMKNISAFWLNLADDEREHIRMLENLKQSLGRGLLNSEADHVIFQIALENSKVNINDILNTVGNLNDAYMLAQLWENSEVCRVFEYLFSQFVPVITNGADSRFALLHLATHRKKMEAFSYSFGTDEVRNEIVACE